VDLRAIMTDLPVVDPTTGPVDPDCSCPFEWKGLGILYGISMGKGWVRMSDDPKCPHHGEVRDDT
jgi:hypothetical protein